MSLPLVLPLAVLSSDVMLQFAADFVEKTLFKRIMVRLLQAALAETAEQNPAVMLTEEILRVDEQLLQIEKSSGEFSGEFSLSPAPCTAPNLT